MPEHVGRGRFASQDDLAPDRRGQRRGHLEDEDRGLVAARIERQISGGDLERRGRLVQSGCERLAAEIARDGDRAQRASLGIVVGGQQIGNSLRCGRIACMD